MLVMSRAGWSMKMIEWWEMRKRRSSIVVEKAWWTYVARIGLDEY